MMRLVVVFLLLLAGSSSVLPQVALGAAGRYTHGNYDPLDSQGTGHAMFSGEIADAAPPESSQCTPGTDLAGSLWFYACRAGDLAFGTIERAIAVFTAVLALSTILLWIYTRRIANAAREAARHIPAVERAYVFGGPTELFLLNDEASVRLAMQNYGKTPAVLREWLVEFVVQEPRGPRPSYDDKKRVSANEILEPDKLFSPSMIFRSDMPAPFFVLGYIKYEDVFRESHTTRFCVGITPDGAARYGGSPAWNGHD